MSAPDVLTKEERAFVSQVQNWGRKWLTFEINRDEVEGVVAIIDRLVAEVRRLTRPFNVRGAERMATAIQTLIEHKVIAARSEAGDALLDYRDVGSAPSDLFAMKRFRMTYRGESYPDIEARSAEQARHLLHGEWPSVRVVDDVEAVEIASPTEPSAITDTMRMVEHVAHAIYDAMRAGDPEGQRKPWVHGGNSDKQYEARKLAREAIDAARRGAE